LNIGLRHRVKWIWGLTKGRRWHIMLYFLLEVVNIAVSLMFVFWTKHAVDVAVAGDKHSLKNALILSICSVIVGVAVRNLSIWISERTNMKMIISLQNSVIKTQMHSVWTEFRYWRTGDIQVRINSDCQDIVFMLSRGAISFVLTFIKLVASSIFLWFLDPMLSVLILTVSPLFLFSKIYFRKLNKLNKKLKNAESEFGNIVQENLKSRMFTKALGIESFRWQKVKENQKNIFNIKSQLINFSVFSYSLVKLVINIGFLITFCWGAYRILEDEISFGTMTAFLQLVGRIQMPIINLIGSIPYFIRFRTAVERVYELQNVRVEEKEESEIILNPQNIELKNISFKYCDKFVIENLSIKFSVGEPVAVIGSSGRGKTTIMRLLLALIEPSDGRIFINTKNRCIPLSIRHRPNIAYVPQGNKLFNGTIRENLRLGNTDISDTQIMEALYTASAEFIYELPDGLDSLVGESGFGLSEGQIQRIAIARALLKNCSIWLFDEITSALDSRTSSDLIQKLLELGKNKIIVFITHDMKLAGMCSKRIYV